MIPLRSEFFVLLFSLYIFSDHRSLKIESENNSIKFDLSSVIYETIGT